MTYQLFKDSMNQIAVVFKESNNISFRLDGNSKEKKWFINEIMNGKAQLKDVEGNIMTEQQSIDFVKGYL